MTKIIYGTIVLSALIILNSCGKMPSEQKRKQTYNVITEIKTTPIKDQGNSNISWLYAMLATIESERIERGDSVDLSVAYITRMMMKEKAQTCFFSNGQLAMSSKGMAITALDYIEKYGAEPYGSYRDLDNINYNMVNREIESLAKTSAKTGYGLERFNEELDETLDKGLGFMPSKNVYMYGAQYTPKEFAHSVYRNGEYIALTSFTHHPFYSSFALEIPENTNNGSFYNLPISELLKHINKALIAKHPVCWEGNINFNDIDGDFVTLGNKHEITQEYRQRKFEKLEILNNHAMEIVGIVQKNGEKFYKCKNCFGEDWGDNGFVYLSEDFVALNTIDIIMCKTAF